MEIGTVRQVDIDREMQEAYLNYAMSVIVARALPDARDGLKPVQRRILYAMHDIGLGPDTPYKKSARIVGEVLGKYHPHGDAAVYDAMARMAQDFSLRIPVIDGQGNFGSVDGDRPAAMRYTEARLAPIARELLADIQKDTVDFAPNFDGTLEEPTVLPAAFPKLLVNGASGIAVGMATSIPPHNLGEVCDALVHLLDNWKKLDDIGVDDLVQFIKGPDFPTGGTVYRRSEDGEEDIISQAYGKGRGKFTVRARVHLEEMSRSRNRIVVTELPFQVNKSNLIERIAALAREGRVEGITDLRDESDRQGMRLVIELSRTVDPDKVLSDLFKHTPMESTFSLILLALVDGEPRLLTLKKALLIYLEHRQVIVTRRSQFELARAKERAHILEGLLTALDRLDEVIDTIRRSRTAESAKSNLTRKFALSDVQAQAILDMPLRRLAALERRKIQREYREKVRLTKHLERLLASPGKIRSVAREELLQLKDRYADARRTLIVDTASATLATENLVPDAPTWVAISQLGTISRSEHTGKPPRVTARAKEAPLVLLPANTRDTIYLFTAEGKGVAVPCHQLPEGQAWRGEGVHYAEITPLRRDDVPAAALARPVGADQGFLVLATRQGVVKRVTVEELPGVSSEPFVVMNVPKGDALCGALWTNDGDELLLVTSAGKAIRFRADEVRPMGLPAGGVRGVKLSGKKDSVVSLAKARAKSDLLVISDDGQAKRSPIGEYPTQGRYGQGVITIRLARPTSSLAGACIVQSGDSVIMVTKRGSAKTISTRSIAKLGRSTQGNQVVSLRKGNRVVALIPASARRVS
jgi:DNA gyrase subunit A